MSAPHTTIRSCRSCDGVGLEQILDLGVTALADRLLSEDSLSEPEPTCPLTVWVCPSCSLMQIGETVRPDVLFGEDYPYYSSVSPALLAHFRASVEEILARRSLTSSSLVVELASNDGYLLQNYVEKGIPVLGIDPATGPATRAIEAGIDTRVDFFTFDLAKRLAKEGVAADVVHANNVVAHVADTNGFVAGIATILKDDGEAVVEFPYVRDLVEHVEFDTIYHQHLCYFSMTAADRLFRRHGLVPTRALRTSIHGGSLRIFASKGATPDESVDALLREEARVGLDRPDFYRGFGERVDRLRRALRDELDELRAAGRSIAGYGAAAKACTLMSATGIDRDDIEVVVDRNEMKHGRFMPGSRIPIRPVSWLAEHRPDYLVIFAWNFADEIMAQLADYREAGGRFLIPVPHPVIV